MGYAVLVGDDRAEYARSDRYPEGVAAIRTNRDYEIPRDRLPAGRELYVAVVTRCWETDLAALRPWLSGDAPAARYIGLIGSERKVRGVFDRLRAEGLSEDSLGRIHGPIGLAIGAVTPEEIAVSIMAEVTAVARGVDCAAAAEPMRIESR
jgi:xanthine dehydrogenase accessory factor